MGGNACVNRSHDQLTIFLAASNEKVTLVIGGGPDPTTGWAASAIHCCAPVRSSSGRLDMVGVWGGGLV